MVTVYREHRVGDVQIRVFVVDGRELGVAEVERRIAEELDLARLVAETELAQQRQAAVHRLPRRFVVVKQVAAEQHKIDVVFLRKDQYLLERVERIVASNWVFFLVADVTIGGH